MKASVIVFKTLLIGVFLFLLSPMAFGHRLPLQIGKSLGSVFGDLKIDTKKLSAGEIKFLEDAASKSPVRTLEDPRAEFAIFGTSSSYADQAYRRLFFSRLNPHSVDQMSAFFESLETHYEYAYTHNKIQKMGDDSYALEQDEYFSGKAIC